MTEQSNFFDRIDELNQEIGTQDITTGDAIYAITTLKNCPDCNLDSGEICSIHYHAAETVVLAMKILEKNTLNTKGNK